MSLFLYGFLIGGMWRLFNVNVSYEVVIAAGLVFLSAGRKSQQLVFLLFFLSGIFWAKIYYIPLATVPMERVEIRENLREFLVIEEPNGRSWMTHGYGKVGDWGKISCKRTFTRFSQCRFLAIENRGGPTERGWEIRVADYFTKFIYDQRAKGLVLALFFGDKSMLDFEVRANFRKLGLVHLLAISGLHISILATCLELGLSFVFRFYLTIKAMNSWLWSEVYALIIVLVSSFLGFYMALVGYTPSSQRAFFVYITLRALPLFSGSLPIGISLMIAATMQILFFPAAIFSIGNLFSWGAYIFVLLFHRSFHSRGQFVRYFVLQLKLSLLAFACTGIYTSASFLANFLITPLFPFVFFTIGLSLWFPSFEAVAKFFLDLVEYFGEIMTSMGFGEIFADDIPFLQNSQWVWVSVCAIFILRDYHSLNVFQSKERHTYDK